MTEPANLRPQPRPMAMDDPEQWDTLTREERDEANRIFNRNNVVWWAERSGRRLLDGGYVEGAELFCAECAAGQNPEDFGPVRGRDSHGDCAEDGERVYWTLPLEVEA